MLRPATLRKNRHGGIVVQQLEERDALPLRTILAALGRHHTVHSGAQPAVAPALHDLAEVHQEATGLPVDLLPDAVRRQHLQRGAARRQCRGVVREDGEGADVGVRRQDLPSLAHGEGEQVHGAHMLVRHAQQLLLFALQDPREDAEEHLPELLDLRVVLADRGPEARQPRLVGPRHLGVRVQREVLLAQLAKEVLLVRTPGRGQRRVIRRGARPRLAVLVVFR
mmetsp:Transcript_161791/g.518998  ORF Transcript_161791/g.518998 Transcript_161791/m.518998 type:complete len:224 (-) Transcript_161791:1059-1730(-)